MPASRKIQNIETPESHVPKIEVRWLADTPQYSHIVGETVSLPADAELDELRRMGWVEDI